jgi:hypothetical protein
MKLFNKFSILVIIIAVISACSRSNYRTGAAGGGAGGLAGAGIGAAVGAGIKNGAVGKSALVGGAVGLPVGIAAGVAVDEYSKYSEEKILQEQIDSNSSEIQANEIEIAKRRAEADDQNRVIEVSPSNKRPVHTGPTLGNQFR